MNTIYNLTNQHRQNHGLNPLRLDTRLNDSAMIKAKDICDEDYWSHNRPDGTSWKKNVSEHYAYATVGENLAKGIKTEKNIVAAWKASPGHNSNMLGDWIDIGVATYDCDGTVISVQHFATPQKVTPYVMQTNTTGNTLFLWISLPILLFTICIVFYKIYTKVKEK